MIDASEIIIYRDDPVDWPIIESLWSTHEPFFGPPVMRRCVNGKWETRDMTDEEMATYESDKAW